jgi:transposase
MSAIVPLILRLFPLGDKYLLILDRTNWKWGKMPINILMLSVAYKGISIPLFWVVLDLEGNTSAEDRISIFKRVLEKFGLEKIEALIADREFVGKAWFRYLVENKIPFVIRIKKCFKAEGIQDGIPTPIGLLCKGLGRKKILNQFVTLWGHHLYISIQKKKGAKEPMIVASNFKFENALGIYRRRWEIETMFGCLKTRGFRMEDTHITDPDKIERLMFVLAIAFCWAYRAGDIRAQEQPIQIKTHGRKARSLFREGVNLIRRALFGKETWWKFKQLLSCFRYSTSKGCAA